MEKKQFISYPDKKGYEFFYVDHKVKQTKYLISHESYLKTKEIVHTNPQKQDELQKQALKALTGGREWFTDKSPLFESITTGLLKCNGEHVVIVKKIL